MTISEFCEAVAIIGQKYGGSVTSWGRSRKHTVSVGGFAGDPHELWLATDMVYDQPGAQVATRPNNPDVEADAATLGLKVIHETTHDHYQPIDLPPGAVHGV